MVFGPHAVRVVAVSASGSPCFRGVGIQRSKRSRWSWIWIVFGSWFLMDVEGFQMRRRERIQCQDQPRARKFEERFGGAINGGTTDGCGLMGHH